MLLRELIDALEALPASAKGAEVFFSKDELEFDFVDVDFDEDEGLVEISVEDKG